MPAVSSAAGLLSLLAEENDDLKQHALTHLNKVDREQDHAHIQLAWRIDLVSRKHCFCRGAGASASRAMDALARFALGPLPTVLSLSRRTYRLSMTTGSKFRGLSGAWRPCTRMTTSHTGSSRPWLPPRCGVGPIGGRRAADYAAREAREQRRGAVPDSRRDAEGRGVSTRLQVVGGDSLSRSRALPSHGAFLPDAGQARCDQATGQNTIRRSIQHHTTGHTCHTQVFYHLGELDDALNYALGAGSLFDVEEQSEYVTTLVGESRPRGWAHRGSGGAPA